MLAKDLVHLFSVVSLPSHLSERAISLSGLFVP